MAAQYISDQIKTRGAKGVVDADDIAYSYKTDGIEQINTSVKDEIDTIKNLIENTGNTADKIQYVYTQNGEQITTTVKNTLDSLKSGVSSIEENKNATQQFYNQAVEIKSKIDTLKENISGIVEETNSNIKSLQKIAESFNTAFDADARFEIMSTSTYNAKKAANELVSNCIYFCYD